MNRTNKVLFMQLITPVELPKDIPLIKHSDNLIILGSCFAENIGKQLMERQFKVDINPFGILYNPLSVAAALNQIISNKRYTTNDIFEFKDSWHSEMHHGSFSSVNQDEVIEKINNRLSLANKELTQSTDWLFITFGSAYVYTNKSTGNVVSNCHKQPERTFNRRRLSVNEIVETYKSLLNKIRETSPNLKVLFTVSPIRHVRDGLHANQISKSTLLLAIDEICNLNPHHNFYFPSFEIMMDELRDYRFYANDLFHPSELAIEYIWQRFSSIAFSKETKSIIEECEKIEKLLQHKPIHPQSEEYKRFLSQTVLKIEQLNRKYPKLDFSFNLPKT